MEVPEVFRGMKKVKEYPNHVLYEKTLVDKWGEEHTEKESVRIKEQLKDFLVKIDHSLQNKLKELKQSIGLSHQTTVEIAKQESDLKWMEEIIQRVNGLINF